MKKKENQQNNNVNNGIAICDSIVMSVKKKRINLRRPEAIIIAVMGFVSVIMAFLGMFSFHFDRSIVANAALVFSAVYIFLSLTGKKSGLLVIATALIGGFLIYREIDTIVEGYQYVYNVIYKTSYHTEINYYKYLKPALEKESTTAFFVAAEWLLALIIYYFTIAHPNPILPLLVTFPIIEVGLYNGIELPVFWGVLVVAYWLALLAMSNIDMGEYSGGTGGFVRKDNLFFPKRQMRLKVTEKCGMIVAFAVILTGLGSSVFLEATNYKRSDEINRKRSDIRDAVNSFSMENIAESLSELTKAFGFTFNYQNHKLGNIDHLKYKNTVDLTVTLDHAADDAVYLKEYTGSSYHDNCWDDLPAEAYENELFSAFSEKQVYPQDFPFALTKATFNFFDTTHYLENQSGQLFLYREYEGLSNEYLIWINSKLRSDRSFAPYATDKVGLLTYNLDKEISSKTKTEQEFSYKFYPLTADQYLNGVSMKKAYIARKASYSISDFIEASDNDQSMPIFQFNDQYLSFISDPEWEETIFSYASEHGKLNEDGNIEVKISFFEQLQYLCDHPQTVLTLLMEMDYRDFVYENYLTVPEGQDMDEIRTEFQSVLNYNYPGASSSDIALAKLGNIREKLNSMVSYSLSPGKTPQNRDFVNYFIFENQKGYCTHYATAGVLLARMAGIPARYATGYVVVGDDFNTNNMNENGSYTIDIKDSRSHAWIEVYIDGIGWLPYEFTEGYNSRSIDTNQATAPPTQPEGTTTTTTVTTTAETTGTRTTTTRDTDNSTLPQTSATAATVVTTVVQPVGIPEDEPGEKWHMPPVLRAILDFLLLISVMTATIILRRKLLLKIRENRMMNGSNSKRISYIYGYTEKLLAEKGLKRGRNSYADFAGDVEKLIGGIAFPDGEFTEMTKSALEAAFSTTHPADEALARFKKNSSALAEYIYRKSGRFTRFWLKYIKVLL